MARIVNTDNFAGEYPDESFVLHPMRKEAAEAIAEVINKYESGDQCSRYWKVVADDYKLQPGLEP